MTAFLAHLQERSQNGRKLLVPYLMAGAPDAASFVHALGAVGAHADALEVGLAYSDPLMDGPLIASAGERALREGIGPARALALVEETPVASTPRVVMTYYNPIHHSGESEFCKRLAAADVAGLIVPDLPLEESAGLRDAAAHEGLAWIPLVAPTSPAERVEAIAETATGFVYAVSSLGVTGVRTALSERAAAVARRCKEATDHPVLVGIGVSTPAHAREATEVADGVVIGSAVVKALMEQGVEAAASFIEGVRAALDDA